MDSSWRKGISISLRVLCVALAIAALGYVLTRVDAHELLRALRSAHPGWLCACVGIYGLVLLPSAWRWHLALRLTHCAVRFGASLRMTLIGHFFYTLLFGAAGGDAAKSVLYSRWYHKPLPEVLAAAPLDRSLGFGGLLIFMAGSFGLASANGAFASFGPMRLKMSGVWIGIVLVVGVIFWKLLKRFGADTAIGRAARAFAGGVRRLFDSRRALLAGLGYGLLVQLALAASLAFGLQAVSHAPVPWGRLAWTFPVISVASALPVNVAGMGLREGAVLALLGLYGISPADAVAASLLTFLARIFWAAVGGAMLLHRQQHHWQWWPRRTALEGR